MASRRAAFISLLTASLSRAVAADSGSLQSGQRLAKPGLSGFNSNSSPQTTQVLIGKAIQQILYRQFFLHPATVGLDFGLAGKIENQFFEDESLAGRIRTQSQIGFGDEADSARQLAL